MIRSGLKHCWRVLIHKWFVFRAGLWCGVPLWRLIIHDWSKFSPTEIRGYGLKFFKGSPLTDAEEELWQKAWKHHWSKNDHHPEYWQIQKMDALKNGTCEVMTPIAVAEMCADWLGASRAYNGKWPENFAEWAWWQTRGYKLPLNPISRNHAVALLEAVFLHRKGDDE
jgi:hypothetical protein